MPIIKSAKKALRQNSKRQAANQVVKKAYRQQVKKVHKEKSEMSLSGLFSRVDRATKKGVIHSNKANRIKSRLARLVGKLTTSK